MKSQDGVEYHTHSFKHRKDDYLKRARLVGCADRETSGGPQPSEVKTKVL